MKIPNLSQMIDSVESENDEISIGSILRNCTNHDITLDLWSGLQIIDHQLQDYCAYADENPLVDLCILDTMDKWVYRENNIDIHHAIMSVVYECVKNTEVYGRFANYLQGGPYPMVSVMFDMKVLLDAVARLGGQNYQGET